MEHRKLPRPGWKLVKSWLKAKLLVRSIFGICISLVNTHHLKCRIHVDYAIDTAQNVANSLWTNQPNTLSILSNIFSNDPPT